MKLRRRTMSHALLTQLGVPRRKDNNRLGLRKRTQMAEKAGTITPIRLSPGVR